MEIHESLYALQVVFQSISSLAIAGGLVYTSFQFRHYKRAAHVANFSKLVELQMQLRKMRVDDPELAGVFKHDLEGMNSPQEVRYYFMNLMQLSLFEIAWFGHRHGQLPEDYFQSWVKRMDAIQKEESFRKMMASPSMKIMHDDFQKYMNELMKKSAS
jgi:hypothetical protein